MASGESTKAVLAAAVANLGVAIAKFAAFAVTGSSSMLSEGIHSVADTSNQILLLIGGKHATAAPDKDHPFGRSGARYLYGFIVAIVLFLGGGVFALYEGIHKIQNPEPLRHVAVAIVVLVIAMILEAGALRTALRISHEHGRRGRSLVNYVRRSRNPELPVVLLEDTGALIGLTIALTCILLSVITGNPVWDGIGSVTIGLLLLVVATFLGTELGSMLIGESAVPEERDTLAAEIPDGHTILSVIHMRTLHLGPDDLLVAVKVEVAETATMRELAAAINAAEARMRNAMPEAHYIFIEPDLRNEENPTQTNKPDPAET